MKSNKAKQKEWIVARIAASTQFTVCMFLGSGLFDRREARSLDEAKEIQQQMHYEYSGKNYGRSALIYAITPDYLTIHVE